MRRFFILGFLILSLTTCGDAGVPGDVENLDSEQCVSTWWYLEQDGEIVLEGNKAGFTSVPGEIYGTPGITYSQGYFADTDPALGQGCTFLSKTQLIEGIHDNLTCSIATEQGPNPQWIGAESGSDGDHRPVLTSIDYDDTYVIGTFEGTMFRIDTLSVSPPNIQGKVVNFRFKFFANNNITEECSVYKDTPCTRKCDREHDECFELCKEKFPNDNQKVERVICYRECTQVYGRCLKNCK